MLQPLTIPRAQVASASLNLFEIPVRTNQLSHHASSRFVEPFTDAHLSDEIYKSARLNGSSKRHAQVEDEPTSDTEAGPAAPPDDEEGDYGPAPPSDDGDDDEEGRFFGGGITAQGNEILDYVDGRDQETQAAEEKVDAAWLRKTALNFEKRISKNAELRARYEADPSKFIQSEADLDEEIKRLSILAEHSDLYGEFARLGCVGSLVGLLAHENTDIAIDALEMINELTDEDVAAEEADWGALADAALEADLLGLLGSNLERLDEAEEADRNGVYYALSVIENLCSRTATAEVVAAHEKLVRWLLTRIQAKETPVVGQNKQYAAEIIAILVQNSSKNRRRLAELDAVDIMLQLVAAYRKRDPERGGEEEEYMENLFEALACIADEAEGKAKFIDAEGVELCLIMLKEGKLSKVASLRLLDHAAGGPSGADVCIKMVEAGGLKNTFTLFMKKTDAQTSEHLVGIFASLLRLLPPGSAERIRALAKFVEKDYEKTDKLVKLRRDYAARVAGVDAAIRTEQAGLAAEEKEEMTDDWFSRRLDAGLFTLQTIDVVLAWLVAEDDGAKSKIQSLLADRDETLEVVKGTIQEQLDGIDVDDEAGKDTREMLTTLAQFLR